MEFRIIKAPSQGAIDILMRRKGSARTETPPCMEAVGLVQGRMIEMVVAADIAEKAESLNGLKLMQAEIIGGGSEAGRRIIVVDIISAGIGDRVIVTTGSSARRMLGNDDIPVDAVVVGIIDEDCEFE